MSGWVGGWVGGRSHSFRVGGWVNEWVGGWVGDVQDAEGFVFVDQPLLECVGEGG